METQTFVLSLEQFSEIVSNQETIVQRLDSLLEATLQLNGYFYFLIFLLLGIGAIYLFYKFLKIFL